MPTPDDHPALLAWQTLGFEQRAMSNVEPLVSFNGRRTWKSDVYRIAGAAPDGSAVIAKRAARRSIEVEEFVYRSVLAGLAVRSVRCFGTMTDEPDGKGWIFLEEIAGAEYEPESSLHRHAATEWLAAVHTGAASAEPGRLPDRGAAHHAGVLARARKALVAARVRMEHDITALAVLDATQAELSAVDASWCSIASVLGAWPATLVHGDFTTKNVRFAVEQGKSTVLVIDWDIAGWGPPATDAAVVAPEEYQRLTSDTWPGRSIQEIERLQLIGRLLLAVLWIADTAAGLVDQDVRGVRRIAQYTEIARAAHAASRP